MSNEQMLNYYETHPLPSESEHNPGPNLPHVYKAMPNPTPEDLEDPLFNAIWQTIKSWDVNAPDYYFGYCGANGSHVMLILNALRQVEKEPQS